MKFPSFSSCRKKNLSPTSCSPITGPTQPLEMLVLHIGQFIYDTSALFLSMSFSSITYYLHSKNLNLECTAKRQEWRLWSIGQSRALQGAPKEAVITSPGSAMALSFTSTYVTEERHSWSLFAWTRMSKCFQSCGQDWPFEMCGTPSSQFKTI